MEIEKENKLMKEDSVVMKRENYRVSGENREMKEEMGRVVEENKHLKALCPIFLSLDSLPYYSTNDSRVMRNSNRLSSSTYQSSIIGPELKSVCYSTISFVMVFVSAVLVIFFRNNSGMLFTVLTNTPVGATRISTSIKWFTWHISPSPPKVAHLSRKDKHSGGLERR